VLGHTARSLEGAQRREAAAKPPPVREAREPPAGIEPAPRPYKGRVLPLTLRRQRWRWQESNLRPLGASEVLRHQSFIPKQYGRVESNHHSQRHQGYSLGSSPVLSVRIEGVADRIRTDAAGITTPGAAVTPQPP
jgi:hypothetical protein